MIGCIGVQKKIRKMEIKFFFENNNDTKSKNFRDFESSFRGEYSSEVSK